MGFWNSLGDLIGEAVGHEVKKARDYKDSFERYYEISVKTYANMTNDQLQREVQRLKNGSGIDPRRAAQIRAIKEEGERRGVIIKKSE